MVEVSYFSVKIIFILLGVAGLTEEFRQANGRHLYSEERPCCLYLDRDQTQEYETERGNLTGKSRIYYNGILGNIPIVTTTLKVPFKRMQWISGGVRIDMFVVPSSQVSAIFEEALKLEQSKL